MSSSQAGSSTEVIAAHPIATAEIAAPDDRPVRLSRDHPLSSGSTGSNEQGHRKHLSVDGRELSYLRKVTTGESESPTKAIQSAEQLRSRKLFQYIKIWRSNYVLTLGTLVSLHPSPQSLTRNADGGGVRGYAQLIILKALMDKVAELERTRFDDNGNRVQSSFHPIPLEDVKQKKRSINGHGPRSRTGDLSNGHTNGHAKQNGNGKGKEVETDSSSEEESFAQFYPYHYFDWIAGTSTGG